MSPSIRRTTVEDADAVMLAVPGASGTLVRTGVGTAPTTVIVRDLGAVQLAELQFGFPIVANAWAHDDAIVLCTLLRTPPGTRWEGAEVSPVQTVVYPPATTHHASDPDGFRFGLSTLRWSDFEAAARDLGADPTAATRRHVVAADAATDLAVRWRQAFTGSVASGDPRLAAESVLDAAVHTVCRSAPHDDTGRRSRWECADLVDAVVEHLAATGRWRVPLLGLCRHVGVSERRLQYAFRRLFDMGPNEYMRRRALQAAHVTLVAADPQMTTVATIAADHGFHHGGRFAAYYREAFGEAPVATLRRAVR